MSPFDNTVKIKMFNVVNSKLVPLDLNLSSAKYKLVFETSNGKLSINNANSDKQENLAIGELVFNISKQNGEAIVSSNKQVVYITSIAQEGTETLMYNGEWRPASQQVDVDRAIKEARTEAEEIQSGIDKIAELVEKIDKLENSDSEKYDNANMSSVKKRAPASVVNKFGTQNPKKINTNSSNAGSKSTT